LKRLVAILLPISFLVSFHARDLVRLAFHRGRFGDEAVASVALPFAAMIWCVFPWCVQIVMARALYARGKFWFGAALGTVCVLVAGPTWALVVHLYGKRGIGPGLVFLVLIQAFVFSLAWRKGPLGKTAFAGLGALGMEVAATSLLACWVGSRVGGLLPAMVSGAVGGTLSVGLIAGWAVFRHWPGLDSVLTRLRTRFGRT
jgi:putative peptidoglycan lipid II flippase